MKSKVRSVYIIQYTFIILLVCGLTCGMLFDLNERMPLWLIIAMWLILVGFPIFTIYSYKKIPNISIDNEKLISQTINKRIEIPIEEVESIESNVFRNKVYSIGYFYIVKSNKNVEIEIPKKMYKNETELIDLSEGHTFEQK